MVQWTISSDKRRELGERPGEGSLVYLVAIVGFTQPFFITPCEGRKVM